LQRFGRATQHICCVSEHPVRRVAAPVKYEAEYATSETHRWVARDAP